MGKQAFTVVAAAIVAGLLTNAAAAQQACTRNGQTYADGSRIGDLKCEDGRWVVVQ